MALDDGSRGELHLLLFPAGDGVWRVSDVDGGAHLYRRPAGNDFGAPQITVWDQLSRRVPGPASRSAIGCR
ncbi:hypothetical protein ACIA8K_20405 [Catenuloplanes sp. NPDC051500]|uniref:hypothetical protein n=1 Tax=Catenuloplanes sp. NPDC051500 TaxID=3363959 RepID=UPI00378BC013